MSLLFFMARKLMLTARLRIILAGVKKGAATMLTTGNQLKAARALAGIDQIGLAKRAGVNPSTIGAMEKRGGEPFNSGFETVRSVAAALELAGCRFVNGDGVGVIYKPPA